MVQRRSDLHDVRLVWDFVWLRQHSLFSTSWPRGAVTLQRSSCAAECANWVKTCWHFTNTSLQKQHETHPVNYRDDDGGMTQTRLHQDTAPGKRWPPKPPLSFGEHLQHLPAWKLLCSLVQLPPWKIRAWSPARSCSNICAALSAFGVRSCCRDIPSESTFNERCGRRSTFFLFLCKKNNSKAKDNVTPQQPGLHKSSGYLPKSDTVVLAQSYYPPATADDSACGNRKIHSQLQLLKIPIWYKSGWSLLFNFGWTFRLIFFAQNGHGGLISLISYNKITSGKDLFAASVGTIVTTNDAFSGPIFNLSAQVGHLITQCVVSATRGLPIWPKTRDVGARGIVGVVGIIVFNNHRRWNQSKILTDEVMFYPSLVLSRSNFLPCFLWS